MAEVGIPWGRAVLILLVGTALGVLLMLEALKPVKHIISGRYTERGDAYMLSQEFDLAADQYEKAVEMEPSNQEAQRNKELAKHGQVDIAALKPFFISKNQGVIVQEINKATQNYTDPKEALTIGLQYYTDHRYAYAQYALERAVELDPGYSEAWHYLYLNYTELARFSSEYRAKADDAKQKRDAITNKYLDL